MVSLPRHAAATLRAASSEFSERSNRGIHRVSVTDSSCPIVVLLTIYEWLDVLLKLVKYVPLSEHAKRGDALSSDRLSGPTG